MGVQTSKSLRGHNSSHCTLYGIMLKKSISCSKSQNLEHLDSATMAPLPHPFSYLGRTVLAIISRWLRESLPSPLGILTSIGFLILLLKNIVFYLFLAMLNLCRCMQAFSSCSEGSYSSQSAWASHCGGFFCCRWTQQLWHTGLVVLWHVESSWTRDRTHVPCIGRQILNHQITRGSLLLPFKNGFLIYVQGQATITTI